MPTDDPFANDRRAELEARITALLLGEYEGSVAADLQEAIDADSELRALRDRLAKTIGLLDAVASPAVELPLDDDKREAVLERFKEPVPELATPAEELQPTQTADIEPAQPWFHKWARPIGLAACLGGLLVVGVFSLLQSFTLQERSTVAAMANLEEIDEENAHWAWGDDAEGGKTPARNERHRFSYLDPGDPSSSPTPNQTSDNLVFSLAGEAPDGISIDEKSGVIEWNRADGIGSNPDSIALEMENNVYASATLSIVPENPTVRDDWGFDSDRAKKWSENIRRSVGREQSRPTPGRSAPTSGSTALYLPQSQPASVSDQSLPVFAAGNDGADIDQLSDKISELATANNSRTTLSGSAVNFTDSSIDGVALQGRDLAMGTTPPTTTSDDFAKAPEVFFDADFDRNGKMAAGYPIAEPAGTTTVTRNAPITLFARNGNDDESGVNPTDEKKPMDGGGQNLNWGAYRGKGPAAAEGKLVNDLDLVVTGESVREMAPAAVTRRSGRVTSAAADPEQPDNSRIWAIRTNGSDGTVSVDYVEKETIAGESSGKEVDVRFGSGLALAQTGAIGTGGVVRFDDELSSSLENKRFRPELVAPGTFPLSTRSKTWSEQGPAAPDTGGHATFVAGIIASSGGNSSEIVVDQSGVTSIPGSTNGANFRGMAPGAVFADSDFGETSSPPPVLGDIPMMGQLFRSESGTSMGQGGGMAGGGGGGGFQIPRVSVRDQNVAQASSPAGSPGIPARRFGRVRGTQPSFAGPPDAASPTGTFPGIPDKPDAPQQLGTLVPPSESDLKAYGNSSSIGIGGGTPPEPVAGTAALQSGRAASKSKSTDTAALIQDGKLLYEMRLLDESKKKLREAIEKDPNAKPAYYYLSLIQGEEYGEDPRKRDAMQKDRLTAVNSAWEKGLALRSKSLPEPNPYYRTNTYQAAFGNILTNKPETFTKKKSAAKKAAPKPKPAKPLPRAKPNPIVATKQNAFSTFSLNVSDVSFKLAAASLEQGRLPDPGSVRSEEFVNAFDYRDPAPSGNEKLAFAWERARDPFAHNRDLIRFSVQTAAAGREPGRALNLVVLLDNSGSMERVDRVMIIRQALRVLSQQLTDADKVSVVAFARTPRLVVDGLAGNRTDELLGRVLNLNPQGGTNLEAAMDLAYATAEKHFSEKGNNRVILFTDGAANLGNVDPAALRQKVESFRGKGVALDCFGIGWDGYNDAMLETLSRNGDGRYGFLNRPETVNAEFADQLAGALRVAAKNVKAQIAFNPSRVISWRQIGYEKHQLKKEQFRENKVDAAEIGAAEAGTALYSIQVDPNGTGPIGVARIRFLNPATGVYEEKSWPLAHEKSVPSLDQAAPSMRLAASAAMFAEWLAQSPYAAEVSPEALTGMLGDAAEHFAPDARPEGLANMIRQARLIGAP